MNPQFETERLILREMRRDDAQALFEMQSPEAYYSHQAVEPRTRQETDIYLDEYFKRRGSDDDRRLCFFAATLKADGRIIGQASLMVDQFRIATLGFGVATAYWRQGYGIEIVRRVVAVGFEELGLHRIRADVAADHAGSIWLLEKIGMVREGLARDCIWARQKWWTEAQYAMLEDDFRKLPSGPAVLPRPVVVRPDSAASSAIPRLD